MRKTASVKTLLSRINLRVGSVIRSTILKPNGRVVEFVLVTYLGGTKKFPIVIGRRIARTLDGKREELGHEGSWSLGAREWTISSRAAARHHMRGVP